MNSWKSLYLSCEFFSWLGRPGFGAELGAALGAELNLSADIGAELSATIDAEIGAEIGADFATEAFTSPQAGCNLDVTPPLQTSSYWNVEI